MPRALLALVLVTACALFESPAHSPQLLPAGTWGGKDVGMIVSDTGAHLHVGCTVGEVIVPITLDALGRFDVPESHNLTAFPIDAGVFLPARLEGRVDELALSFTLTIDDTVHHRTVVLGPVRLRWGARPEMGPCPICRVTTAVSRPPSAVRLRR